MKKIDEGQSGSEGHEVMDYVKVKENFEMISNQLYRFLARPKVQERQRIFKNSNGVLDLDKLEKFPKIEFK